MFMAQAKHKFVCQECGYTTPRGLGKCPGCQAWNSFAEETEIAATSPLHRSIGQVSNKPEAISNVKTDDIERQLTGMPEFDRVLGGGIVPGSVILIGGDPGIGKSNAFINKQAMRSAANTEMYFMFPAKNQFNQTKIRSNRPWGDI